MKQHEGRDIVEMAREMRWTIDGDIGDQLTESLYANAAEICRHVVDAPKINKASSLEQRIDQVVTSRRWGFPIMLFMLAGVLWITIIGSNYPSQMLSTLLVGEMHPLLGEAMKAMSAPWWLTGFLVDGVYLAVAWVVAVMLPPMAIFFPLFTLMEDFGYLPRVAFNLDNLYRKAGAHGKQALTMSMGFGCNAAGVVAARVIDSPRERLIAIITNNFSLCNGRWPTQILIATIFLGAIAPSQWAGVVSIGAVLGIALLGVSLSFVVSWMLSRTLLKGEVSTFHLELPPYRPPLFWQTLYTSLIDRTLIVLWRAVVFAAPAGAVIWLVCNVTIGGEPLSNIIVGGMDGFGLLLGLNGVILLAYIVAIPANEIVIPTILMLTVMGFADAADVGAGRGVMFELDSANMVGELLRRGGWTILTGVNLMLFSLLHNPCSTTIFTIYKETKSAKWTAVASLLPLLMGLVITFLVAQIWGLF